MLHSQGVSNNSYPELNQSNSLLAQREFKFLLKGNTKLLARFSHLKDEH